MFFCLRGLLMILFLLHKIKYLFILVGGVVHVLFIIDCNRSRLDDGVENFIHINIYLTPICERERERVQAVYIISELIACEKNEAEVLDQILIIIKIDLLQEMRHTNIT